MSNTPTWKENSGATDDLVLGPAGTAQEQLTQYWRLLFKLQHPLSAQEELKTEGLGGCLPAFPVLRRPWVPRLTQAHTCLAPEGQRQEARIWVCTARRKRELNISCVKHQGGLRCVLPLVT